MSLVDGMILCHGSYAQVDEVRLDLRAPGKDFGKGYYLTSNQDQAMRFVPNSVRKAQAIGRVPATHNHGFVMTYRVHLTGKNLQVYEFATANADWLRFVSFNRRSSLARTLAIASDQRIQHSDIIIGKIANDTTNAVITTYLNGLYGEIGKGAAEQMAISLLLPNRLKDQYCFRSSAAVACLELVEVTRHVV
ncbi:MAG: DUF3990 domain-containing protein [Coriobacteriales bacterium]|nr:DUF3990 domain-containing protein [Coriobacteriales bacterium]